MAFERASVEALSSLDTRSRSWSFPRSCSLSLGLLHALVGLRERGLRLLPAGPRRSEVPVRAVPVGLEGAALLLELAPQPFDLRALGFELAAHLAARLEVGFRAGGVLAGLLFAPKERALEVLDLRGALLEGCLSHLLELAGAQDLCPLLLERLAGRGELLLFRLEVACAFEEPFLAALDLLHAIGGLLLAGLRFLHALFEELDLLLGRRLARFERAGAPGGVPLEPLEPVLADFHRRLLLLEP